MSCAPSALFEHSLHTSRDRHLNAPDQHKQFGVCRFKTFRFTQLFSLARLALTFYAPKLLCLASLYPPTSVISTTVWRNLQFYLPAPEGLVSLFSTRNGVPCCRFPALVELSLAPPPSGPCVLPLPFLCSPLQQMWREQLDPDEKGKKQVFFRGMRCYYACVCVAVHAGWSQDSGPLHPSPLLERKSVSSFVSL